MMGGLSVCFGILLIWGIWKKTNRLYKTKNRLMLKLTILSLLLFPCTITVHASEMEVTSLEWLRDNVNADVS